MSLPDGYCVMHIGVGNWQRLAEDRNTGRLQWFGISARSAAFKKYFY
jgi:hypothetical protein